MEGLRTNLRSAGIAVREEDVERVVAEGIPDRAAVFRALLAAGDDCIPDYLSGWSLAGPDAPGDGEPARGSAAGPPPAASCAGADSACAGARDVGTGKAAQTHRRTSPPGWDDREHWPSTIAELAPLVRAGAVSPVELTERALTRIEEDDGRANAFQLVLVEEARSAARHAEDEVARGGWRGPLHGIPVAVKDLLAMKGTVTTSGSRILADHVTDHDAAAVELHLGEPLQDAVARSWARANRALEQAGATLVQIDLDEMHLLRQVALLTLCMEAAAHHAPMLRTHYDDYGECCRGRLVAAFTFSAQDFLGAQRLRHWIRGRWDAACRHVDLLSLPCQPGVAPLLDMRASTDFTNLFNALGWPAISVPCGYGEHYLPLAVQLVAKPWDEATLLRAARAVDA